ncbi:hypothetical protein ACSBL2_24630 [Pedobacter sp. AW31-3R]|uniref:hypothetical protein n=1 Tax=Pedobacter sp. AW31-3R TaxID=3445781 RepID=UPI003FA0085A
MIDRKDKMWKSVFNDFPVDGIKFFYPKDYETLDLERKPEFLNTELIPTETSGEAESGIKIADMLIKFYTRKTKDDCLIFHFEVQDKYNPNFDSRMITYNLRGRDKFGNVVISCAIFTEVTNKKRSGIYKSAELGNLLYYRYNTYKVSSQSDEELLANPNPFAIIILTSRIVNLGRNIQDGIKRDQLLMMKKLELFKIVYGRTDLSYENKKKLLIFINSYIIILNKEISITFDKEIYKLNLKLTIMGIEEVVLEGMLEDAKLEGKELGKEIGIKLGEEIGIELGELKKQNEIIAEMLKANLPDEIIALTIKLPIEEVNALSTKFKSNTNGN